MSEREDFETCHIHKWLADPDYFDDRTMCTLEITDPEAFNEAIKKASPRQAQEMRQLKNELRR